MNEFDLIKKYFTDKFASITDNNFSNIPLGIGDDCALMTNDSDCYTAISTDTFLEGTHFFKDTDPFSLGFKSLAVNLSDLAAMGAKPIGFTLALTLPNNDSSFLERFSSGMYLLAKRWNCPLIGGDTTRGPLSITITVFGSVTKGKEFRRANAKVGDYICVSGALGGAAQAVAERYKAIESKDKLFSIGTSANVEENSSVYKSHTLSHSHSHTHSISLSQSNSQSLSQSNSQSLSKSTYDYKEQDIAQIEEALQLIGRDLSNCRSNFSTDMLLDFPFPRLDLVDTLQKYNCKCALDLSDGLTGDLQHILDASQVSAVVDIDFIPTPKSYTLKGECDCSQCIASSSQASDKLKNILSGGDDYELLFTIPSEAINGKTSEEDKQNNNIKCDTLYNELKSINAPYLPFYVIGKIIPSSASSDMLTNKSSEESENNNFHRLTVLQGKNVISVSNSGYSHFH